MTTPASGPTVGPLTVDWPLHSCDDHLDLPAVPTDLWTTRMRVTDPARVPHVEVVDGRTMWVCDGSVLGLSGATPAAHTCYERGGIEQDGFRPSNPVLRLQDLDRDGVAASVIYGPSVMGLKIADDALQAEAYRCWNDWAAEFNRVDPNRLCILARLPSRRPEDATAEIERVAALGHRGAVLDPVEALVGEPEWEPFWAAAEAAGLPISYHLGGGSNRAVYQMGNWREPVFATVSPMQLDEALAETVFSGVLERHPGVRLVLAEAGLEAFFALQVPIAALLLLLTVVYVRRTLPIGLRASGAAVRRLARETLPLAVASTMIVLYGGAMVIIVSLVASDYQTGLFVTSARVMEVVVGLPALVIALALPVLSVASTTDHERLRNALQLMVELGLVLAALVAVTLALAADGVIALIGGSAFAEAAPILQVQAFAIVGVFLSQTLQNALVSLRQQQTLIITNAVALAAVIGLGVVLVSRLGAIGGAWAILAAEALLCLLLVVTLLRRAPQVLPTFRFTWKVAACLAVAGAVVFVPLGSSWLSALLGALAFAILAGLLRAVPAEAIVALASPVWGEERVRGGLRRYYGAT